MDVGWLGILLTCFTATGLLSVASIAVCNTIGMHLYSYDQGQGWEKFGRAFTHLSEDAHLARELVSGHPRCVARFHKSVIITLAIYCILALWLGGDEIAAMPTEQKPKALSEEREVSGGVSSLWDIDAAWVQFFRDTLLPIMAVVAFFWSVLVVLRVAHISRVSYKALMLRDP